MDKDHYEAAVERSNAKFDNIEEMEQHHKQELQALRRRRLELNLRFDTLMAEADTELDSEDFNDIFGFYPD